MRDIRLCDSLFTDYERNGMPLYKQALDMIEENKIKEEREEIEIYERNYFNQMKGGGVYVVSLFIYLFIFIPDLFLCSGHFLL